MLIDLVIEIISFVIRAGSVKANQLIRLVFNANKKNSAFGICKTSYAFQPAWSSPKCGVN